MGGDRLPQNNDYSGITFTNPALADSALLEQVADTTEQIGVSEIEMVPQELSSAEFFGKLHTFIGSQMPLLAMLVGGNLELTAQRFANAINAVAEEYGLLSDMARMNRVFENGLKSLPVRDDHIWQVRKGVNLENIPDFLTTKEGNVYRFAGEPLGNYLALAFVLAEVIAEFEIFTRQGTLFRDVIIPHNLPGNLTEAGEHTAKVVNAIAVTLTDSHWLRYTKFLELLGVTQIDDTLARWENLGLVEVDYNVYNITAQEGYRYAGEIADQLKQLPTGSYELRRCTNPLSYVIVDIINNLQLAFSDNCPISSTLVRAIALNDFDGIQEAANLIAKFSGLHYA